MEPDFLCVLRDLCGRELPFPIPTVDHAFNTVFKPRHVEIDQQPHAFTTEPQVGQQLGFMDGMDALYALDLDDYKVFH